jgi:hypothetical protein
MAVRCQLCRGRPLRGPQRDAALRVVDEIEDRGCEAVGCRLARDD